MTPGSLFYSSVQPGFEEALESDVLKYFSGALLSEKLRGWLVFSVPDKFNEALTQLIPEMTARGERPPSLFSRSWGHYLGKIQNGIPPWADPRYRSVFEESFVLQSWIRRDDRPGAREKRPLLIDVECRDQTIRRELLDLRLPLSDEVTPARNGMPVLNAIRINPGDWRWGLHRQSAGRLPLAGGELPWPKHDVPSRAYMKCQEALYRSGAELLPGQMAVELGCSPGGTLLALIEKGLNVVGIDPAELSPTVLQAATLRGVQVIHHKSRAESLDLDQLPKKIDWFFSDMNVRPQDLLTLVETWIPELVARGLKGFFLTLKLTDPMFIPCLRPLTEQIRGTWGFPTAQIQQLSQNRREVLLYAVRPAKRDDR